MSRRLSLASVLFEVTPHCNLACRYCYVPWEAPRPRLKAPRDAAFERADRTLARLLRVAHVGSVTMTGGEPLLQERLPELVLRCRLAGSAVNVISNGTAGAPEQWSQLCRLGVSLFELPTHAADPEIHDGLVGRPGAWESVAVSMDTIRANGGRVVGVVVLTRANAPQLADTLALFAARNIEQVMLNRFNPGGRGLHHGSELAPTVTELREAFAVADRLAPALGLHITSNVGFPHCLIDPHDYRRLRFTSCSADLARRPLALDVDGGLRFCNHSPVVFANIHDDPPESLFEAPYLRAWRDTVPPACSNCRRFATCFGGCRAVSEQIGGTLADVDPSLGEVVSFGAMRRIARNAAARSATIEG
jgi:radical SAM protein with 4Fe4S-binding SPASM domain